MNLRTLNFRPRKSANKAISESIEQLAGENKALELRKVSALSIFKDTVNNLEQVNKELEENATESRRLANELSLQAENAEQDIMQNKKVISKINEIFVV